MRPSHAFNHSTLVALTSLAIDPRTANRNRSNFSKTLMVPRRRAAFRYEEAVGSLVKSLWIAGGAAIGANLRFWFGEWIGQRGAMAFPMATFLINVFGALLIGAFFAWELKYTPNFAYRLFFAVGLCGGFTTFSTFSWEALRLMERGHWMTFAIYVIGSVTLTIAASAAGFFLTKSFIPA